MTMKKLVFLAGFFYITLFATAIDIPPGGINMINDPLTNFTRVGGSYGTIKVVDVEHELFSKALEIEVTKQAPNYWDFQVVFQTNMPLEEDDVCMISFWARTTHSESEAGEGIITAIIEHNQTYVKPLNKTFSPGAEWVHFVHPFKSDMSLAAINHRAAFFAGYDVQTIQVANIQFLNYKNTITVDELPVMEVRYDGMEPDAEWRNEAAQRIEMFRKGNVLVKLEDANNNPVSGAVVSVEMKQHKFGFGTAIDGNYYLTNSTYRNHIHNLFNEVVFENDLKWRPWVNRTNHDYILRAIDSLANRNITVRGHTMIWPGWQYLPDYLELHKNDPEYLKQECLERIDEAAGFTKGKVRDWDVLNEPFTNQDLQNICGDTIMANWFKRVKQVDPDVNKYINDYSILGSGGVDFSHQNGYFDIIQYILEQGGEIDGIGMQGHFSEFVTGIPKVFEILDRFSVFNKEIKITEFDINSTNDELKVKYTRDFMTALFSYPYVKSFLFWGFWEGRHWKPEAALYNLDWSIRPQGETYENLVFNEWWTPEQTQNTGTPGTVDFGSCFLGTYEVKVEYNDQVMMKSVPVYFNLENTITINVDDQSVTVNGSQHPETPVFTSTEKIRQIPVGSMKIYPNPTTGQIHFELKGVQNENVNVRVINSVGSSVLSENLHYKSAKSLQLSGLKPGLYFLAVESDKQQFIERFTIK